MPDGRVTIASKFINLVFNKPFEHINVLNQDAKSRIAREPSNII